MSVLRFFAVIIIFSAVTIAWMALGGSVYFRTEELNTSLSQEMRTLWGPEVLAQESPYLAASRDAGRAGGTVPAESNITADIKHDIRYKGLLWYTTFSVNFTAVYKIPAFTSTGEGAAGYFIFPLPHGVSSYSLLKVEVDGQPFDPTQQEVAASRLVVPVGRDAKHVVAVTYRLGGQNAWMYLPGGKPDQAGARMQEIAEFSGDVLSELRNFNLTVNTDFRDIDYPKGSRSPDSPAKANNGGMTAAWHYDKALTSQAMGVVVPVKANAGPIVARMSFFAPVSLFFFFTVLFAVVVLKKIQLHPMHFLFISAGFFAFHILMAYLADVLYIHAAFWTSAVVSVLLVASYMRLVAGMRFALLYASVAQFVYLIGFSYAFFYPGRTGLAVVIGAVITLFVLMQATGRVNWFELFKRRSPSAPPLPPVRPND